MLRGLAAGLLALLIAAQVVRVAGVNAFARYDPDMAQRFWPEHPAVQLSAGMTQIAAATREGRRVDQPALDTIFAASAKAPLAEEPFLVRGVQAQIAGDRELAGRAFEVARWREGRSLPARYFLADHYLVRRDDRRGLIEIAALARLVPGGVRSLAPYVARYAREPANHQQVRAMLHEEPMLEEATLAELAVDPRNADLVLGLAHPRRTSGASAWLPGLLASLTKAGQFEKARRVWARVAKVRLAPGTLIYDPSFQQQSAPPPFAWALTSSAVGLGERLSGGGLHVIYYGREDGVLASQLLVVPPGSYRLTMQGAGDLGRADSLRWRVVCAESGSEIGLAPIGQAARAGGWTFTVPAGCRGQRLELFGSAGEFPRQTDVTIRAVTLERGRDRG